MIRLRLDSPLDLIREEIIQILARLLNQEAATIHSKVSISLSHQSDLLVDIEGIEDKVIEELQVKINDKCSVARVSGKKLTVRLKFDDESYESLVRWINKQGVNYGLSSFSAPEHLKIILHFDKETPYSVLLRQLVFSKTLFHAFFTLGVGVRIAVCISDVSTEGYEIIRVPIDNQIAITSTPISVFRTQSLLQSIRSDHLRSWCDSSALETSKFNTAEPMKKEFATDNYTYADLLRSAYDLVIRTNGSIVNDTVCMRVDKYRTMPLFTYGDFVNKIGHIFTLIFAEQRKSIPTISLIPDNAEWKFISELTEFETSTYKLVKISDLMFQKDEYSGDGLHKYVISNLFRDSKLHLNMLSRPPSDDLRVQYKDSSCSNYKAINGVREPQHFLSESSDQDLLRYYLHFPHVVETSVKFVDFSVLIRYLADMTQLFRSANKSVLDNRLDQIYQIVLNNSLRLIGFDLQESIPVSES